MKKLFLAIALAAGTGGAAFTLQDDRAAVNKTCPVMKGKLIKKDILSVYDGKPIGFCCEACKKAWDLSPGEYAANLTEAASPKVQTLARIGKPAPEFELRDTGGYIARLADFKDQIVILQWTDPACPVSKRVADGITAAMIATVKKSSTKVVHLSVCSDTEAKAVAVAKFLSDRKIDSRGLMDTDASTAVLLGVRTTCHALVIDAKGVLRYSGAIDNDPAGKKGDKAVNHVVEAVTAILEDKKVSPEKTNAYGTPLKLPK
ncbi:MAG TPA: redoxin domain-containing protein [Planctomycetota bacterium]|nr:redoxin domain-containing protein [Planctomycetota bacterium]